ncbi:hypothetical protein BTO06_03900 [Tenacibaculum sp. SZ-18]|uniref:tyrosine-type recombinase/integrase n=1 Tax=Tenacibaculum sp. SZ-18 TaxID=754423 RepID=UPI000C2CEC35|nr:site-specific integrase [Tenacibaculum sp. SZ-18]AUC14335.1 hypothetical protein BTO06_03900 [Tenacibaculum sp. SZ-18]
MEGRIYLDTREHQKRKNGYPVICHLQDRKRLRFSLKMNFMKKEWDFEKELPLNDKRKQLIIKRKKGLLADLITKSIEDRNITLAHVKEVLTGNNSSNDKDLTFYDFVDELVAKQEKILDDNGVQKKGNAGVYRNAAKQLYKFKPKITLDEIDYTLLDDFKQYQLELGNKKNTIHSYLRTFRAVYNEAVRRNIIIDKKPFKDIFKGISVKKNRTKKRHLSKTSLYILENLENLADGQKLAIDFFLLQFYFGGQDFRDIYYLKKNQLSNNRVYFTRGKLDENGYEFDLAISAKAKKIIDYYKTTEKGEFLFPFRKDYNGYKTFIRRVQKNLQIVQSNYNDHIVRILEQTGESFQKLTVEPHNTQISTKVSRHTFGTIGSRLFIEPDLLRALMGHERDDVDTIYKDVFPETIRDLNHFKIISTEEVSESSNVVFFSKKISKVKTRTGFTWNKEFTYYLPSDSQADNQLDDSNKVLIKLTCVY